MFDQISRSIDEFGNSVLNALNEVQGFFGKELSVVNPVKNSILELVGNTPLIRLNQIGSHIPDINFYIKAEFQNPTGSIRDRSALAMIRDAEKRGKLTKDGTIVLTGTGSSPISLSWAGRTIGYKVICYLPEGTPEVETIKLRHYGAEIRFTQENIPKLLQEINSKPNHWYPNENSNMANPNHHFSTTGPEIFRDMAGKVDYLVTGGGTGGTVTGIGRFFRSIKSGIKTKVILTGWKDSSFEQFFSKTKKDVSLPDIFDPRVVDEFVTVTKDEAVRYQSDLLIKEGIPVGITAGMILCGAIRYAETLTQKDPYGNSDSSTEKKNLIILCPDRE